MKKTYQSWQDMKQRYFNHNNHNYKNYGARGISVCERWLKFQNFLSDMGQKPDGLTLERKDNNGNYEPNNCRWATRLEQRLNQRDIHNIEINGITKPLRYFAQEFGIDERTVHARLRLGWDDYRAITTPVMQSKSHRISRIGLENKEAK